MSDPSSPSITPDSPGSELPPPLVASSEQLKALVRTFMTRAEGIRTHPLFGKQAALGLELELDDATGNVTGGQMETAHDVNSWAYLTILLRPLVFLQQDPLSLRRFINLIAKEHEPLRPFISNFKSAFSKWQTTPQMLIIPLGDVEAEDALPEGEHRIEAMWTAEPGTPPPDDVDMAEAVSDIDMADVYLNGCMWHSDTEKALIYENASIATRSLYIKSAEIRTLSSVRYVNGTYNFIKIARLSGYDF